MLFPAKVANNVDDDAEAALVAVQGAGPDGGGTDPGPPFASSRTLAPPAAEFRSGRCLRRRQRHHERLRLIHHD